VDAYRSTTATARRHRVARIISPALVLLLILAATAVPAQAATSTATSTATAGATWSQLMRRKLALAADSARLTALLPRLRASATTGNAELARAQKAQQATATSAADAATADQTARSALAAARTAAAAAKKAVADAQKRRPRSTSRVTKTKSALTTATARVRARAATAGRTASALRAALTAYALAGDRVTSASTAYQSATKTLSDTQLSIAAQPKREADLAAQAAAISKLVVTQTRASFTATQTTQVYGTTVNKIAAYPFQQMVDAAAKAGIRLSGGGFRTKEQQIALRTRNGCPDVWAAPASSCRVPTAIPGRSLHELGLAVDLTAGGKSISSRKSAAFVWLAANAGRYGFVNLPSEPWHWSITGN
jgi:D-alanyl-D-alanine carboxypeptidase